jgi:pectate lyase
MQKYILISCLSFLLMIATTVQTTAAPVILQENGRLESAWIAWQPVDGAVQYNVYYSGEGIVDRKIDAPLIRRYASYFRADALGLKAGVYTLTVKAVDVDGTEFDSATSSPLTVRAHDRSGFAFSPHSPSFGTASGAYNDDGTLRAGAQVIYLTEQTVKTVTLNVISNSKGQVTACTGIGDILTYRQKGFDTTPLAIRIIGKVTAAAMNASKGALGSDNDLQIKGKKYTEMNTTVEGVGNDATAYGWGILVRGCMNVEVRNIGFMDFPEDGVSLNTDNRNIWVHNNDFFYGKNGGGDKDKGDGSLDSKESGYTTFSYNHFWDSGKCNLLGNGTEEPELLTYHHNWYDHSDSRHPRVRFHTVHVYNNYYDGNSKYGIGAAKGGPSIFVEANYFRNCKYPMLISLQGSDVYGGATGTFSSEDGGIIKAFNNHIEGAARFVPYNVATAAEHFDAVVVDNRNDPVGSQIKALQGGATYNNFDTNPDIIYMYTPDSPEAARDKVVQDAGRTDGGDFQWTFTNADDTQSEINTGLAAAIKSYTSSLISIQSEDGADLGDEGGDTGDTGGGDEGGNSGGGNSAAGAGGGLCDLVAAGAASGFVISGNTATNKGSVTVNGIIYSCCLKMESATTIDFSITSGQKLVLVLDGANGKKVKLTSGQTTTDLPVAGGKVEVDLAPGAYTLKKGDTMNLFYLSLSGGSTGLGAVQPGGAVYFDNGIVFNPNGETLRIYTHVGQQILSTNTNANLSAYPGGIYLLHLTDSNHISKIIKR